MLCCAAGRIPHPAPYRNSRPFVQNAELHIRSIPRHPKDFQSQPGAASPLPHSYSVVKQGLAATGRRLLSTAACSAVYLAKGPYCPSSDQHRKLPPAPDQRSGRTHQRLPPPILSNTAVAGDLIGDRGTPPGTTTATAFIQRGTPAHRIHSMGRIVRECPQRDPEQSEVATLKRRSGPSKKIA